jgi:glycerate kinase
MKPTEVEKVRQRLVALEEVFIAANPQVQIQRLPPAGAAGGSTAKSKGFGSAARR